MADPLRSMADLPPVVHALGFSAWKRRIVRKFLGEHKVVFVKSSKRIPPGSTVLIWGRREVECGNPRIVRVEDGFLRSVGLGARLTPPLSWVFDPVGIYYDAGAPSYLELLIETAAFDDDMLRRAARLRERIVAEGITKYNTGVKKWLRPENARHVILVPGQVESDASVRLGSPLIGKNIELLECARKNNPGSYIVYKPHPDVAAGLRLGGIAENAARRFCDEIVTDASSGDLLCAVDEVHTMTSLMGFEALLRGKKVICYGLPFYSGWGLTTDMLPNERRTRRVTLDELVCAALFLYPRYMDECGTRMASPEETLDALNDWRERRKKQKDSLFSAVFDFFLKLRAH